MKKLCLIPNWRKAWRMISMQAMAAGAGVQAAWAMLADDMKGALGPDALKYVAYLTVALLLIGMGGRVVKQPKVEKNETNPNA